MHVDNSIIDPVISNTANTNSGQGEQGDVFAEIFSNNIDLNTSSSPNNENVNESYDAQDDQTVTHEEFEVNDTDQGTQNDTLEDVEAHDTETANESQSDVGDEESTNPKPEENNDDQPESETEESSEFLNQLASDPNAQQTQQKVAVTVKGEAETQQHSQADATSVKVAVSEPVAEEVVKSKPEVKTLIPEAPVAEKSVDATDKKIVQENNTKLAEKEIVSPQAKVEVVVDQDQDAAGDFEEVEPEQVKPILKNDNESTRSGSGDRKDGAPKLDLNQTDADLDAKAAASGLAESLAKDKKADRKNGETTLIGAMREVSSGKVDVAKGAAPAAKSEADSLITREQVEQVVKAAKIAVSRGSSQVQLRLDPPELGQLRIEIKQTASGLQLQVQATNPKTQQMLDQTTTQLRSALESQGFQSVQIEVQLRMDLRNEQGDQNADQFNQGQSFEQGEETSQSFDDTLEEQWSDTTEGESLSDETLEHSESSSESQTPQQWQEMEFTTLNVVA